MPNTPKWLYSFDGHVEYIRVGKEEAGSETIELREGLVVDIDQGKIVRIEIIHKHE